MLKVVKNDGESSDRLIKRFSNRIKSRKLMNAFRAIRYNRNKPSRIKMRGTAVVREQHRAENKKREFYN